MGDNQHTQNIQINEVTGENEKCVFYFMEKTKWTFWPTQYFQGGFARIIYAYQPVLRHPKSEAGTGHLETQVVVGGEHRNRD